MSVRSLAVLALALCCVSAAPPQRAPEVRHFKGQFICFAAVDWVSAVFCTGDSIEHLSVTEPVASMFVAAHPGATLDITATAIDPRETGLEYGLTAASLNGYPSDKWWKAATGALGYERADKLFEALVDSLTTYPGDGRPWPPCPGGGGKRRAKP